MNLDCLNSIITQNLAIQFDLTNKNSWNLNSNYTVTSLTKWTKAISSNLNLLDFGLTSFDNGRTNLMYDNLVLVPNNNKVVLYRVGKNIITNPSSGQTSGATSIINYDNYGITGITATTVGNYFNLNGGYIQGFFKLKDYNHELFPARYNNGITIETILEILPQSSGIFLMLGTRAEDKYNTYFSGETILTSSESIYYGGKETGNKDTFMGVWTSENNYLESENISGVTQTSFRLPELKTVEIDIETPQNNNISNNIIAFELTEDRRLGYKYVDSNGNIVCDYSPTIIHKMGWIFIDVVFLPNGIINKYDPNKYLCYPTRKGTLYFYVNGRLFWKIDEFDEFYFRDLNTDKEKQIGVPFNISWGGGSFGLKNSYHYNIENYNLYKENNLTYINNNFYLTYSPVTNKCYSGNTSSKSGLTFNTNSIKFTKTDECSGIVSPLTVFQINGSGATGNTYFIKYKNPIYVLSNRKYEITVDLFDEQILKTYDDNNKITLLVYGSEIDSFTNVVDNENQTNVTSFQDYQYVVNGVLVYGGNVNTYVNTATNVPQQFNDWNTFKFNFKTKDNSGKQKIYIGLLIESNQGFTNKSLYLNNLIYSGSDIYSKDSRKNNLLIEQNFDNSYIGNIQKLRIYDVALTSTEILHNAWIESQLTPSYGISVSKGGRIIQNYLNVLNISQQTSGSDIRKTIRFKNADGSYRNLINMTDILVVVKSRSNPSVELVKFKKYFGAGWLALIQIDDYSYDFIVPDTITSAHPNEVLFAEIKFQWSDPNDIDSVFDKIFVVNLTTNPLMDNTVKNY